MSGKLPMHPRYAEAYGDALSSLLKASPHYDESQCQACPHEHRCCDLIVTCSAVEAFSIVEWVRANRADAEALLLRVADRAKEIHTFAMGYSSYADEEQRISSWIDDWFKLEKKKCPFYDAEAKKCGIYPVRPANCRKAWGQGDCGSGGVRTTAERKASMFARATRLRESHLMLTGEGEAEMTWLISHMIGPDSIVHADPASQSLLRADPANLTVEDLLYGQGGKQSWVEDPFELERREDAAPQPNQTAAAAQDGGIIL